MASRTPRCDAAAIARHLAGPGAPALRAFVERQRWFAAKAHGLIDAQVEDWAALCEDPPLVLFLFRADDVRYYVPVALGSACADPARMIGPLAGQTLFDAHWHPDFGGRLLEAMAAGRTLASARGSFRCAAVEPRDHDAWKQAEQAPARPHTGEQSNTSMIFDRSLILKSIRQPASGINPEFEMLQFLTSCSGFTHVPRLVGWVEHADQYGQTTVALLQEYVSNTSDGWTHVLTRLGGLCARLVATDNPGAADTHGDALGEELGADMYELGAVSGRLHAALASPSNLPTFRPEPISREDVGKWCRAMVQDVEGLATDITAVPRIPAARAVLEVLLETRRQLTHVAESLAELADGVTYKIRCHGDFHLGQVLKTPESFAVVDFEGEPARTAEERRAKHSPLRDVAGMLRSFDYAVHAALTGRPESERGALRPALEVWEGRAVRAFLDGYTMTAAESPARVVPASAEAIRRVCAAFELEKACYELRYEINNRPDWVPIPLGGIARLLT